MLTVSGAIIGGMNGRVARVIVATVSAVVIVALAAASAQAALFFLFSPTSVRPGDRVVVRTGGTPLDFELGDRVRPLHQPIEIYLVPNSLARAVHSRSDPRLVRVGTARPRQERSRSRGVHPPKPCEQHVRSGGLVPPLRSLQHRERAEAAVLAHFATHDRITAADVQALLEVSPDAATSILRDLRERGVIAVGSTHACGRGVFYIRGATRPDDRPKRKR